MYGKSWSTETVGIRQKTNCEIPQSDTVMGLTGRSFSVDSFSTAVRAAVPSTTFLRRQMIQSNKQNSVNLRHQLIDGKQYTSAAAYIGVNSVHYGPQNFSLSQILPSVDICHPFQTDFADIWTCLRLFSLVSVFFLVSVIVILFFFSFFSDLRLLSLSQPSVSGFFMFYIAVLPFQFLSFHFCLKYFQFFLVYVLD